MSVDGPSERQSKIETETERTFTQAEAVGRQAAREAGYEPLPAHGHDSPSVHGFDRPGPRQSD
jgi:hypothetical protein